MKDSQVSLRYEILRLSLPEALQNLLHSLYFLFVFDGFDHSGGLDNSADSDSQIESA